MKNFMRGILYMVYLLFWLVSFELMRVFFILFNFANGFSCSASEFFGALLHGFRMDMSATAYVAVFIVPVFIAFAFIKSTRAFRITMDVLTGILLFLASFIVVGDAEVYRSWQYRIDASVLQFFDAPGALMASVSVSRFILLAFIILVMAAALFFLYKVCTKKLYSLLTQEKFYSLIFILAAGFMVIPARGGLGIVPMNVSVVYFSDNYFANHAAINVCWNFFSYFFASDSNFDQYMFFENVPEIPSDTTANEFYGRKILSQKPDHIVFVLLESFTWTAMCYDNPAESVTPELLKWRNKGIFFSNCYASGDRSVRGIASIFSGVPSLPEFSVMKNPRMSQQLTSLLRMLAENGYKNISFHYGGDANFSNMNSFFYQNGVKVVSQNNLDLDCRSTRWGYDDECMFDEFFNYIEKSDAGSVSILFTIDSHEPYDVPISPYGTGDELSRCKNAYRYTDICLDNFLKKMKASALWDNSLVILVSDHGKMFRTQDWNSSDKSHIIMQWLGGSLEDSFECNLPCDQADISSTLLSALGISHDEFLFSEDIFGKNRPTAFAVFGHGFSYIMGDNHVWYAADAQKFASDKNITEDMKWRTKAYCQKIAEYYSVLR